MVIGCCGAGKSTLAQKLSIITGLPVFHLDQYYWKENWVESEKQEWREQVIELANKDSWIIDGNYGGTMDIRLHTCDTVIFLDYPTFSCIYRVLKRTAKYHGTERPDMPKGCKERYDLDFLHYVATFNIRRRKNLYQKLQSLSEKEVVILKSDKEVSQYLENLKLGS